MPKHNITFEIVNKSDLFFKYRAKLNFLMLLYGDNATIEDINNKNEEIRKGGRR